MSNKSDVSIIFPKFKLFVEKRFQNQITSIFVEKRNFHPIFHVSQLKKHIGSTVAQATLPVIGEDQAVTQVLVQWTNSFPEDSTLESLFELKKKHPTFDP